LSDGRHEVADQGVDFAQIFPSALFRFQLAIANDDREIADLVQHSARDVFDRAAGPENGETDKQIVFKPGDVCPGGGSQIAVQRVKFGFKHRDRRRLPLCSATGLFTFCFSFHAVETIGFVRSRRVDQIALLVSFPERFAQKKSPPGTYFPGGL
jgi:hypothetical protein